MGNATGELADRFHFLRLTQYLLVVPQLCGALFDLLLQGLEGVLQAQFTHAQVDQPIPGFILSSATAQGGAYQADQGFRVEGAFEERDIAQQGAKA